MSIATSLLAMMLAEENPLLQWAGCQAIDTSAPALFLPVSEATSMLVYCYDDDGRLRSVRTLVVSGRKKVSLI